MPEMRLWYEILMELWYQDLLRKRNVERRQFFLAWAADIGEAIYKEHARNS